MRREGAKVRAARMRRRWTQAQLGLRVGPARASTRSATWGLRRARRTGSSAGRVTWPGRWAARIRTRRVGDARHVPQRRSRAEVPRAVRDALSGLVGTVGARAHRGWRPTVPARPGVGRSWLHPTLPIATPARTSSISLPMLRNSQRGRLRPGRRSIGVSVTIKPSVNERGWHRSAVQCVARAPRPPPKSGGSRTLWTAYDRQPDQACPEPSR